MHCYNPFKVRKFWGPSKNLDLPDILMHASFCFLGPAWTPFLPKMLELFTFYSKSYTLLLSTIQKTGKTIIYLHYQQLNRTQWLYY